MSEFIVDSELTHEEALAQKPGMAASDEFLRTLAVLEVKYYGFDHKYHVGQIVIAESVADDVETFFDQAREMKFPIAKVMPAAHPRYMCEDARLMADNVSSGFNYRLIAGTETPSLHGLGVAFDINPRQNPYIRYDTGTKNVQPPGAVWDRARPGTLYAEHPLVKIMEDRGWEWGGNWAKTSGRIDYQHFEKAVEN